MITGVDDPARIRRKTSNPSIMGSIRSRSTRSGLVAPNTDSACSPSSAVETT